MSVPPSSSSSPRKHVGTTVRRRAMWFAAELVVVFVGVYGAFLLNAWREDRRHERQREQVYGVLLQELRDVQRNTDGFTQSMGPMLASFDSLYEADAMPSLMPFFLTVRFTPHMWNATLETAGLDVLDVQTMYEISAAYNTLEMAFEQLDQLAAFSREVLIPNSHRDRSEFYDTTTARLRTKYAWYYQHTRQLDARARHLAVQLDSLIARMERDLDE